MVKTIVPALLLLAGFPVAASAQESGPTIAVSYRDLDLRSANGIAQLDRRIERAIAAACAEDAVLDLQRRMAISHCRAAKRQQAAAQREQALARAGRPATEVASAR